MGRSLGRSLPARVGLWTAIAGVCLLALWIAIHRVGWLGPLLADSARAVVGPTAVARVEDFAYGLDDRWNQFWRRGEQPMAYWAVPSANPSGSGLPKRSTLRATGRAPFRPKDVGPVHKAVKATGDGVWVPMVDPRRPDDPARFFKTLVHPDSKRPWAAAAIVAIDLRRVDIHLVPGTKEPSCVDVGALGYQRTGLVPPQHQKTILAAFNGGFKSEHGRLGVHTDGVTFLKPLKWGCTIARYKNGSFVIRSWPEIASTRSDMVWLRQAPTCLVEVGEFGRGVQVEENINWGMSVDGETVIRRSAAGLSKDGKILYVGIGDSTTAWTMAQAMRHVGGYSVIQLDVNWSYPKFLAYEPRQPGSEELVAKPVGPSHFTEGEYIREPAPRDFFYVICKEEGCAGGGW